ncbi:MAG: sialate O-acetylesterase [Caulobacteraceae bacterium]|nr:MAG: sialate O-acetylesterase [Caulobacteraceae bacterium]
MKRVAVILAIAACVVASPGVEAAAQGAERPLLHSLFQDHAVVQRGQPLHVWGWTGPNERVMARLDNGPPRVTRADRTGAWRMSLGTLEAGGPHTITAIAGGRTQVVTDVLAGDVFLCSGQSNMEFPTRLATNSTALLREAPNPQIRLFQVSRRLSATPQHAYDAANRWMVDEPAAAGDFSAVCYLFGRAVQRTQHVPVGLIHASWGGTPIEAWMSEAALRGAGRGDEVELAAAHARDPQAADRRFAQGMQQWRHDRDPGVAGQWNAPDLDDRDWATVSPEGFWEDAGEQQLAHLDGIVWFRTDFTLSAAQASLGGRLELGPADDADVTYVNGQRVGGEDVWDAPRAYAIAPGVLREGRNVLASSVLDTGGGGGFWGAAGEKQLHLSDGSRISLAAPWRYRIAAPLSEIGLPPRRPWGGSSAFSTLFNGMIAPAQGYGMSAVLWYQGETNAGEPRAYERLLPAMFADWRAWHDNRNLEFYVVQLAAFGAPVIGAPVRDGWGRIRDVQRRIVAADPHAALAVSIDLGDRHDIHPTQKLVLAERLARLARRRLYAENIEDSGPVPLAAKKEGGAVRVSFGHGPLVVHSGARPASVELCTSDRACRFVDARVQDSDMFIEDVAGGDAFVRYCWGDSPICNLFNASDLPAVPFELAIE